eukprot:CAMPEP_0117615658 /NCGR_PEP_ID=MMETSP0784-20121206/84651_1 /TAXON_ID=39447 /ORGANISM="" /LENGTH=280 /DNA_ID=CAMNT_0005419397 /DNA_START=233 /DNA_END=1073 /DNA_ORIENTATION=-
MSPNTTTNMQHQYKILHHIASSSISLKMSAPETHATVMWLPSKSVTIKRASYSSSPAAIRGMFVKATTPAPASTAYGSQLPQAPQSPEAAEVCKRPQPEDTKNMFPAMPFGPCCRQAGARGRRRSPQKRCEYHRVGQETRAKERALQSFQALRGMGVRPQHRRHRRPPENQRGAEDVPIPQLFAQGAGRGAYIPDDVKTIQWRDDGLRREGVGRGVQDRSQQRRGEKADCLEQLGPSRCLPPMSRREAHQLLASCTDQRGRDFETDAEEHVHRPSNVTLY